MATNTPNLNLTNPELGKGEKYDLELWTENNNKIDAHALDMITQVNAHQDAIDDLTADKADTTYVDQQDAALSAQLADKVQNFKLKNEVVNGDFSQGLIGWTRNSIHSLLTANENVLTSETVTVQSTNGFYLTDPNSISWVPGEKVYFKILVKPFRTHNLTIRTPTLLGADIKRFGTVNANIWTVVSGLINFTSSGNTFQFFDNGNSITGMVVGSKTEYKDVIILKLTQIFGAGNEPTKLEMDELMKVIPNGWWDGELTLTQKQYVTWQLNLIRKNTNAIIALGGTII